MAGPVVLEREVTITIDGEEKVGKLRIELDTDAHPARCDFSIPEIDEHYGPMYGEDAMQALCFCFRSLQLQIETLEKRGISVWLAEPGDFCLLGLYPAES